MNDVKKDTLLKVPSKEEKQDLIIIKGARVNNLKNISLELPRNKFITITGVSGSGKSSLAFDTLYAEGQRRYVESLSSYARQFLGKLEKPDVDTIDGISPAIAIEQKTIAKNPRSTVGTATEIYDYLKLLYARIGKTYSPISGKMVKRDNLSDILNSLMKKSQGQKVAIYALVNPFDGATFHEQLNLFLQKGFSRLKYKGESKFIEDLIENSPDHSIDETLKVLIDRVIVPEDSDEKSIARISDSIEIAIYEGDGICILEDLDGGKIGEKMTFSNRFELDGIVFDLPSVHLFSFNNPYGACPECQGYGSSIGIDEDLVIPNKSLSVYEDALVCWRGQKMSKWKERFILSTNQFDFPIHKPISELSSEEKQLLWTGNKYFKGLNAFFQYVEKKSYKIQYRVMLSRYRGKTKCPTCSGNRLKKEATYVQVDGRTIVDLLVLPSNALLAFFKTISLSKEEKEIAGRLLKEILFRLQVLVDVGLGYLSLKRASNTLSGGEAQRINLSSSLGSSLVGAMYILDEPSIGLHPKDTHRLIGVLDKLKNIGNTVVVVEHDEDIMKASDHIVDIGPLAGLQGGSVVVEGSYDDVVCNENSLTASYLNQSLCIEVPKIRRIGDKELRILGAGENNLKTVDVRFPLNCLTVVSGVSGSGKSSLVKGILYPALTKYLVGYGKPSGLHRKLEGDLDFIDQIHMVDQNPIGKSSRSNPVTYIKAWDDIRKFYAEQPRSKQLGFASKYFSFNIDAGRCEGCNGEGIINVEMQFMADVKLVCEDCKGLRFKEEVLEVVYKGKNVADILSLTVDEALEFFDDNESSLHNSIVQKLGYLKEVGMGYIHLGQPSSTLSGGEAQRVKLASFLAPKKAPYSKGCTSGHEAEHNLFIFDEPTTGLHFHDIGKLMNAFNALLDKGNTIVVVEHNVEVIKNADWVIDLGPEGGEDGGFLVAQGTPEEIAKTTTSYTGKFLAEKL